MMFKQTGQQFDLLSASRQAELNAWLALRNIKKKDLAHHLGIHPSMITRIFQGKRRPAQRIAELIALGIPARLLPEPGPTPGRPGKTRLSSMESARLETDK